MTRILPLVSRFAPTGGHGEKKSRVLKKLGGFFDRLSAVSTAGGSPLAVNGAGTADLISPSSHLQYEFAAARSGQTVR